jgi:hypothetical protein
VVVRLADANTLFAGIMRITSIATVLIDCCRSLAKNFAYAKCFSVWGIGYDCD